MAARGRQQGDIATTSGRRMMGISKNNKQAVSHESVTQRSREALAVVPPVSWLATRGGHTRSKSKSRSMIHQYQVMAAYNRQVNRQFYAACAQLDDAARRQNRGAFFGSIHGTLNHLLLVDRLWLGGFTQNPVAFTSLDEELFGEFDELHRERQRTDDDIVAWAASLSDDWLSAPYGDRLTFPAWLAVTHFFNHQTHHRGQLSALLSQCGQDYGVTDLPWVEGMAKLAMA